MGAATAEKAPLKPVVISNIPDDCKISVGKGEEVKAGSKGIIIRDGKDIAKFEITSVEWGYSTIKVFDNVPGETVLVGDGIQITDTSTVKIKKKNKTGAILGGLLLVAAIFSIKSNNGRSTDGGGTGPGTVGGTPVSIDVAASLSAIQADGNSFTQISATVRDASGKPVTDGTIVDFSVEADSSGGGNCIITQSSATNAGIAVAHLYSRDINGNISKSGTATVVARVGLLQPSNLPKPSVPLENRIVTVLVVSNQVAVIALSSASDSITRQDWIKAGTTFEITAVVHDEQSNAVVDGTAVYFSTTPGMINGDAGNAAGVAASTTTTGIAKASLVSNYQQGTAIPDRITITARCNGQTGSLVIPITTQSGGGGTIARSMQIVANPNRIQTSGLVGGVTSSVITATALANGVPATSGTVTFTSSIGSIVGSAQIVNGIATASFSSNVTGPATITATWEDSQATTLVMVTAGAPNSIEVASTPSSIECDGNAFATITATIRDIAGNNVTDGTVVKFTVQADAAGGGNGTITSVASTSNGQATALLISRDPGNAVSKPGTATVFVAINAADQPAGIPAPLVDIENHKTQVQFTSQDVAEIHIGATKTNIRGWDFVNNTTSVVAVVYDRQHNPVPDGTAVYFTVNHGMIYGDSGTAGNVAVSVTKDGRATATLVSDASGDGSWNGLVDVTATSGNVTVTVPGMVIFSGWPSFLTSSATMFPTTIASAKDSAVITIIARDINGNAILDGTPVSIETTKGILSTSSAVTAGGVVEVTLKTSEDVANPTEPGPGKIKIRIDSGGHNPETGNGPLPLTIDFIVN